MPKFAQGGAFTNSIVSQPTMFDMGLMGEAGSEAIMPLHRGGDGSLGVRAEVPLPQFPALGNNDVVQVLNDVKRELQETRKENQRLLAMIGNNTGNTANAVASSASRAEQQRGAQLDESRAATRAARIKGRTV
jgi:phage-related minor tail protein